MTRSQFQKIFFKIKSERRGGAPFEGWVKQNREILMMQVRNTMDVDATSTLGSVRHFFSLFIPFEAMATAGRVIGVFALVLGTVMGGGLASAQAYRDSIPGEPFYKVKRLTERAQLMLAPGDDYRARLHAEFADRRVAEVARLAEESGDRQLLAITALASFEQEALDLQDSLNKLRSDDPNGVVEVAKLMERKMDAYQNAFEKASATLPIQVQPELARAADLIDSIGLKAIAIIVEKHIQGDTGVSKILVASKFQDRLKDTETKLGTIPAGSATATGGKTATKAKAAIAETKALLKDDNYSAAITKLTEAVELTKEAQKEADTPAQPVQKEQPTSDASGTDTKPAPVSTESSGQ